MEEITLTGNLTYRVFLDELNEGDKQTLFEWINNRELVEFNSPFKQVTWEDHSSWFNMVRNKIGVKIFGIRTIADKKLIGSCQLLNIDQNTKSAELQIRIGYFDLMGKGLGTEAVSLLLKFAFHTLQLNKVYLHVFANNKRAIKSYIRCGFKHEGCLSESVIINQTPISVNVMAILKQEFIK